MEHKKKKKTDDKTFYLENTKKPTKKSPRISKWALQGQDTKLIHKNQSHSYILTINMWKPKLQIQYYL